MKGFLGCTEETVRSQISEALVLLCSQVFHYDVEVTVEALVGVKVDRKEVFLFNVQNTSNKDEERRMTEHIMEEEEEDIEAIMINQDSDEEVDEEDNCHYMNEREEGEDEDGGGDGAAGGGLKKGGSQEEGSKDAASGGHNDSQSSNGHDGGNDGTNGDDSQNENEAQSNESESEAAKDGEGEANEQEADSNSDDHQFTSLLAKDSENHEKGQSGDKEVDQSKNDGDSSVQTEKKNSESADKDSKDNKIMVKRVPRQIVIPPLSKMMTRSKRKRGDDSDSEDSQSTKKSEGTSSYIAKKIASSVKRSSSVDESRLGLQIKDSYSVTKRASQDSHELSHEEEVDDDLLFIKEEITDQGYDRVIERSAPPKVIMMPVGADMHPPVAAPKTIFLPAPPAQHNPVMQGGVPAPIIMQTGNPSSPNKPLIFFSKNHRGELVQVKPPANMKILLPPSTASPTNKTITLTKSPSPAQQVITSLSNNPGLNVLHNLERNANRSPIQHIQMQPSIQMPTIQEPQIRVIQVTPEVANGPNRYSANYERDMDHPTMINKDGSRIKRPMNAFMIWAKQARSKILNESGGTLQNADVSKILGHRWKSMSREEQQPFYDEQRRLDLLHKAHYPEYRYQPKRKRPVTTTKSKYDTSNIISLSPGSVLDHETVVLNPPSASNSPLTYSSDAHGQIITSNSDCQSLGTISLYPEDVETDSDEDLLGGSDDTSLIATPVSASDIIPDLPNLASALAASARIDEAS